MKKDYISTPDFNIDDDLDFVEQFWTQRWQENAEIADCSYVARREEYKLMLPTLNELPKDCKILDAGCGKGEWTVWFNQQGYETVGLDISEDTIKKVQDIFPQYQFVRGDIRDTDFPGERFDIIFSWGAYEHFENGPGKCLKESWRILKPGGMLFISVPYDNIRHMLSRLRPLKTWDGSYHPDEGYEKPMRFYQWRFTKAELEQEIALANFRVKWVKPIHKSEGVKRWLDWDLKISPTSSVYAFVNRIANRLMPADYLAHMVMIAARKAIE